MYSALTANLGYRQMRISEEHHDKTTLVTHRGAFRWLQMPLSLLNTPVTFHGSLDLILSTVHLSTCLVYLSEEQSFARMLEEHIKNVFEVLKMLEKVGV